MMDVVTECCAFRRPWSFLLNAMEKSSLNLVLKITCAEQTCQKNPLEVNGHMKETHIVLDSTFSFVFL